MVGSCTGDRHKLCSWNIFYGYLGMLRWLSADVFGYVTYCEIYWVCHLVTELCKLGFV